MSDSDYLLDRTVPPTPAVLERYIKASAEQRAKGRALLEQSYGSQPREILEIFTPESAPSDAVAPTLIFVHGGWWKAGRPQDRAFMAPAFTDHGIAFVSVGYPLAPEASLPQIVASVTEALIWLAQNGPKYGLDMQNIVLAGNSAGGHLAAMLGAKETLSKAGIAAESLKALCLMSGIFDLSPLRSIFPNAWLSLDENTVAQCSPARHLPPETTAIYLGVGGREPSGFEEQANLYATVLRAAGSSVETETIAGKNHFEVIQDIARPSSRAFEFIVHQSGKAHQ